MPDPLPGSSLNPLVQTVHCKTANEFLNTLSRRGPIFRGILPRQWLFRGHEDDQTYQLVPSALRNNSQLLLERSNLPITDSESQRFQEICELDAFFTTADSIGLPLPEDTQFLRNYLTQTRHEPEPWPHQQVLSLMALAQHHGVHSFARLVSASIEGRSFRKFGGCEGGRQIRTALSVGIFFRCPRFMHMGRTLRIFSSPTFHCSYRSKRNKLKPPRARGGIYTGTTCPKRPVAC
jgi:hypothetical protein